MFELSGITSNNRLKQIRNDLGLNQQEMAQSLELKQGSYSDIERGKVGVSGILTKLIKLYRINPVWLIEGVGEKFIVNEETFFNEAPDTENGIERGDENYKKEIFDLLDILEAPGSNSLKMQVVSDLKGILGRFLLENTRLIHENTKLKQEIIRMLQKQEQLANIFNQ